MSEPRCPFYKQPCIKHECTFYVNLIGKNPQTGADTNSWGCSFTFAPLLTIENTQAVRQCTAAVQELRNETAKHHEAVGTSTAALNFLVENSASAEKHERKDYETLPGDSGRRVYRITKQQ